MHFMKDIFFCPTLSIFPSDIQKIKRPNRASLRTRYWVFSLHCRVNCTRYTMLSCWRGIENSHVSYVTIKLSQKQIYIVWEESVLVQSIKASFHYLLCCRVPSKMQSWYYQSDRGNEPKNTLKVDNVLSRFWVYESVGKIVKLKFRISWTTCHLFPGFCFAKSQRQKNLGSRVALLPGKFLRV